MSVLLIICVEEYMRQLPEFSLGILCNWWMNLGLKPPISIVDNNKSVVTLLKPLIRHGVILTSDS